VFLAVCLPELRLFVDTAYCDQLCEARSGYVFQLANADWPLTCRANLTDWASHREKRLMRSTAGAELFALCQGVLRMPLLLRIACMLFGKVKVRVLTDSAVLVEQLKNRVCKKEPTLQGRLLFML